MGLITSSVNGIMEEMALDEFIDSMHTKLTSFGIIHSHEEIAEKVQKILYHGDTMSSDSAHQIILTYLPMNQVGKFKNRID